MVSRYVEPEALGGNKNVVRQARSLKLEHGINVEILTWPYNDLWRGPVPDKDRGRAIPPLRVESGGLSYHVINPPDDWNERPMRPGIWENAVEFGLRLLTHLRPDIVHLQHWFGLWWVLESAQRLGVHTVYTNHDWGLACLRTILVMGGDALCDGQITVKKCSCCIWQGRSLLGKANEIVVQRPLGRILIEAAYHSPLKQMLEKRGAVRVPLQARVELNLGRASGALGRLDAMFVPSKFGRSFFAQLGVPEDRIQVQPWYHDPVETRKKVETDQPFTITYIGRVSPEKGVHLVLEALESVTSGKPIQLKIAGGNSSAYCAALKRLYPSHAGPHRVEWLGWSEVEPLFLSTDVAVVPSTWIDNTPLSLVESLSYRVPLIATRVPPIEELIADGENGYLADYNSVESLSAAIQRAAADKEKIRSGNMPFPEINTCRGYTRAVKEVYYKIARHK
jgi:glycosyltransferase involved in cell wall biosynthesis